MVQSVSLIEKEFLLKTVCQNALPVHFHGLSTSATGHIEGSDRETMTVSLVDPVDDGHFALFEHVTGYFDCHGTTYAFDTTVRTLKKREMSIDLPTKLLRSLQRTYVRVRKPRDVRVRFHLANEDIKLDYPICQEYVSVDQARGSESLSAKGIQELILRFKESVAPKSSENTIVMFRTRSPEQYEETLISKTGRVLFVPSTTSGLPKNDPYAEGRIITEKIEEQYEDPDYFVTGSRFERLLAEKNARGVTSEIWCPIVYYQYVVGYIYLANRGPDALSFDINMVDYLWDFSRVLAFSLKQSGYFQCEVQGSRAVGHRAEILDMSPGGMLISIPRDEIRTPIKEGSVFSVQISLGGKSVDCAAKVLRRFADEDTVSYGTTFIDLSPQDVISLYEFLYRRPFADDDPRSHEQVRRLVRAE